MLTRLLEKSKGLSGVRNFLSANPLTEVIWPGQSPFDSNILRAEWALSEESSQLVYAAPTA